MWRLSAAPPLPRARFLSTQHPPLLFHFQVPRRGPARMHTYLHPHPHTYTHGISALATELPSSEGLMKTAYDVFSHSPPLAKFVVRNDPSSETAVCAKGEGGGGEGRGEARARERDDDDDDDGEGKRKNTRRRRRARGGKERERERERRRSTTFSKSAAVRKARTVRLRGGAKRKGERKLAGRRKRITCADLRNSLPLTHT